MDQRIPGSGGTEDQRVPPKGPVGSAVPKHQGDEKTPREALPSAGPEAGRQSLLSAEPGDPPEAGAPLAPVRAWSREALAVSNPGEHLWDGALCALSEGRRVMPPLAPTGSTFAHTQNGPDHAKAGMAAVGPTPPHLPVDFPREPPLPLNSPPAPSLPARSPPPNTHTQPRCRPRVCHTPFPPTSSSSSRAHPGLPHGTELLGPPHLLPTEATPRSVCPFRAATTPWKGEDPDCPSAWVCLTRGLCVLAEAPQQ